MASRENGRASRAKSDGAGDPAVVDEISGPIGSSVQAASRASRRRPRTRAYHSAAASRSATSTRTWSIPSTVMAPSPQPFAAIALIAATPLSPSGIAAKGPPWQACAGSRGSGGSLPARIASAKASALSRGA